METIRKLTFAIRAIRALETTPPASISLSPEPIRSIRSAIR